jgi:hypothetical protein
MYGRIGDIWRSYGRRRKTGVRREINWLPERDIAENENWDARPENLYVIDLKTTSAKSARRNQFLYMRADSLFRRFTWSPDAGSGARTELARTDPECSIP